MRTKSPSATSFDTVCYAAMILAVVLFSADERLHADKQTIVDQTKRDSELAKLEQEESTVKTEHKKQSTTLKNKLTQLLKKPYVVRFEKYGSRSGKADERKVIDEFEAAKDRLARLESEKLAKLEDINQRRLSLISQFARPGETLPVQYKGRWYRKDELAEVKQAEIQTQAVAASSRVILQLKKALDDEFAFKDLSKAEMTDTFSTKAKRYLRAKDGQSLPAHENYMQIYELEYDFERKMFYAQFNIHTQGVDQTDQFFGPALDTARTLVGPTYRMRCWIPVKEDEARIQKTRFLQQSLALKLTYRITKIQRSIDPKRDPIEILLIDAIAVDSMFSEIGHD